MLVKTGLEKPELTYKTVKLCEVELEEEISSEKWSPLNVKLRKSGIELMEDKKSILIEQV